MPREQKLFDHDRYEEWIKISFFVGAIHDTLPHHIQTLGIIDADLRGIRTRHLFDENGIPYEDENRLLILERYRILAYMWVLAVCEIVRMIAELIKKNPDFIADDAIKKRIYETKILLERIRIPLAKMEPSRRYRATDYAVALGGVGKRGMMWQINDDIVIGQEDLSNNFLEMMQAFRWGRIKQLNQDPP